MKEPSKFLLFPSFLNFHSPQGFLPPLFRRAAAPQAYARLTAKLSRDGGAYRKIQLKFSENVNQSINRLYAVFIVCISFCRSLRSPPSPVSTGFLMWMRIALPCKKKSSQCHHRKRGPGCADCARSSPACRDAVMPSASGSKPAKSRIRVSRFRLSRLIPQNL